MSSLALTFFDMSEYFVIAQRLVFSPFFLVVSAVVSIVPSLATVIFSFVLSLSTSTSTVNSFVLSE